MAAKSDILNRTGYRAVNRRRDECLAIAYYLPSLYLVPFCDCRFSWRTDMLAEQNRYAADSVKNLDRVLLCEMLIFRRMNAARKG
jgi:hypothetical protein